VTESPLRSGLLTLLVTFFLIIGVVAVQAQTLEEKVQDYSLANGIRVLIVERHEFPTFAAYITFNVGSVNETSQCRGVAHLLEHMRFKGTQTLGTVDYSQEKPLLDAIEKTAVELDRLRHDPKAEADKIAALEAELKQLQKKHKDFVVKDEFARIYAENGGVGYNAFTTNDLTSYLISLPANKLELWADIESDRMLNPVLREFYTERDVVREERRRSSESNPGTMLYEELLADAFTVHPYRNPIIGWDSDIANLSLAETRDFLHRYYSPVNTIIALVGDVHAETALPMLERYFGSIPPGTPVPPVTAVEPEQRGEKRITVEFDAEPQLAIGYHKPTLPTMEDYAFDLIDQILSGGRTSRLYRKLIDEEQLATSVRTFTAPGARYPNLFVIKAVPRYPHTPQEVEQAIYAELERLATEPVSTEELQLVRNRLRTERLRALRENNGLARMLTYYQSVAGDWHYLVDYDDAVAAITPEDIMKTASTYFRPENRTVAVLQKKGGE